MARAEFGKGCWDSVVRVEVAGQFVVSAAQVLDEGMSSTIADMRAELVIDALRMAVRNYSLEPEAIFHTDRRSQYLSKSFAETTVPLDIRHSVGNVGSCFDNALVESFNAALKVERVNRTVYPTREHARKDLPHTLSSATIPDGSTRHWAIEPHARPTPTT